VLGNRSVFHVEGDRDAITDLTRSTLRSLLRSRSDDADMTGITECVEGVLRRHRRTTGSTTLRARVVEHDRTIRRVTRLTVHVPSSTARVPWIRIAVDTPGDGERRWAGTARLVRELQRLVRRLGARRTRPEPSSNRAALTCSETDASDAVSTAGVSNGTDVTERPTPAVVVSGDGSRVFQPRIEQFRLLVREALTLTIGYVLDAFVGHRLAQSTGIEHTVAGASIRLYRTGATPARLRRGPAPTHPSAPGRRQGALLRMFTWHVRVVDDSGTAVLDQRDADRHDASTAPPAPAPDVLGDTASGAPAERRRNRELRPGAARRRAERRGARRADDTARAPGADRASEAANQAAADQELGARPPRARYPDVANTDCARGTPLIPRQHSPRTEPSPDVQSTPGQGRVGHDRRAEDASREASADTTAYDEERQVVGERDTEARPAREPRPGRSSASGVPSQRSDSVPEAALAGLVREVLGASEPTTDAVGELARLARLGRDAAERHSTLAARCEELSAAAERAEQLRRELAARLEDEQLENATTEQECALARAEVDRLTAEVTRLRGRLAAAGHASEAWSSDELPLIEDRPTSFEELLERVSELEFVTFTGSREITLELDGYDTMGTWAAKTWDALIALDDYARASHAGCCPNGVHGYLKQLPDGCRGFSDRRHAPDESETVKNTARYARERTFPVPPIVSPSGELFMGAHFKIARSGSVSPRLHYFDDTAHTGRIYIGYIGKHLNNPHTN
jgi:hypothetical protein